MAWQGLRVWAFVKRDEKSVGDILNADSSDVLWNACAVQGQRRNDYHEWVLSFGVPTPAPFLPPNGFFWKSCWYVAHASGRGDRRATLPPRNLKRKSRPYRIRFICAGLARAGKSARRSHEPVALLLRKILTVMHLHLASIASWGRRAGLFHQRSFASTCKIWVVQALKLFSTSSTDRESGNILPFCPCTRKGVETRAPRELASCPVVWLRSPAPLPIGVGNYRMEVCCTGSVGYVHPCIFWRNPTHNVTPPPRRLGYGIDWIVFQFHLPSP